MNVSLYLHPAILQKFLILFLNSLLWKHTYIHTYTLACLCIINFFLIPEVTYIEMKPTYPSFHSRFFILCHSSTRRPEKWVTGFIFITPTSQRLILERTFWQQSPKQNLCDNSHTLYYGGRWKNGMCVWSLLSWTDRENEIIQRNCFMHGNGFRFVCLQLNITLLTKFGSRNFNLPVHSKKNFLDCNISNFPWI